MVYKMGYHKMITEGAKHIIGWKSPNYVYHSASQPKLKLLLKNSRFSDDIAYRFSNYSWNEYPLTAEKFISWIASTPAEEKVINLFMNYETLGNLQPSHTGIFEFMKALPRFAFERGIGFATPPSEAIDNNKSIGAIDVPNPISWADEERDLSSWTGNKLQRSALESLYKIGGNVYASAQIAGLSRIGFICRQATTFTICPPNIMAAGGKATLALTCHHMMLSITI